MRTYLRKEEVDRPYTMMSSHGGNDMQKTFEIGCLAEHCNQENVLY